MVELTCPSCGSVMCQKMINGIPVMLCPQCGNFVMDRNAFQGLIGIDIAPSIPARAPSPPAPQGECNYGPNENASSRMKSNRSFVSTACELPAGEIQESHQCPGCKREMPTVQAYGAHIDLCPHCGIVHSKRDSLSELVKTEAGTTIAPVLAKMDCERNVEKATKTEKVAHITVDGLFVLYKTGLLITSVSNDVREGMDRDVLGSMMIAITEFVQSSFKSFEDCALESIKFRGKEIAFEKGEHLIVALTLSGHIDEGMRAKIRRSLAEIERKNESALVKWNGDLGLMEGVSSSCEAMLAQAIAA